MSVQEYREFIASKAAALANSHIMPKDILPVLKEHQRVAVEFALNIGKAAHFLDTGLGKSLCELEWARHVCEETKKPVLILTPLAVAGQMVREGHKFGIDARQIHEQYEVGQGIMVANYERLAKLDASVFGGIVLDESSILKSFAGRTRTMMIDVFKDCHFKLAATATPSPNDHTELGNHAEFLGIMRQQEMLSKWFINDTSTASQDWRLKGHAVDDFWQWVASWSRCATMPSDLGGDNTGYVLPDIIRELHEVSADRSTDTQGMLFRIPEMSATSFHAEKRLTMKARCEKVLQVAFGNLCYKLATAIEEIDQCPGSQNTQNAAAQSINPMKKNESAASPKGGRQKKTQNTCGNITGKTQNGLSEPQSSKKKITSDAAKNTPTTISMPNVSGSLSGEETRQNAVMKGSSQHTEFLNLTMNECSQIRDFLAKFAVQNTKTKEGGDCTLTIVTPSATLGDCYAIRVTRLLEKCATMLQGSDPQYDTLRTILLDPVLVFCETNDEQDYLEKLSQGISISVRGSQSEDAKERGILDWCDGAMPWLISKSSIVGFGMNFQHCAHIIFASINFSYEKFYQSVRRVYRFGQARVVRCDVILSDTERSIWDAVNMKGKKHDEMKRRMADAMRKAQSTSETRVKYDRPLDLAFPSWIKSETQQ